MKRIFIILVCIILILLEACSKNEISKQPSMFQNSFISQKPFITETPITPIPTMLMTEEIKDKSGTYKNFYSITKDKDDNYTIKLYDKDKKILNELTMPKEPHVKILGNDIIQVIISYGSPFYYTYFYDTKNGLISKTYDTPVLARNRRIILVENSKLIISDVIDKKLYYKVIKRNFTQTVPPSSAIFCAKLECQQFPRQLF